jgi:hypothetical protein
MGGFILKGDTMRNRTLSLWLPLAAAALSWASVASAASISIVGPTTPGNIPHTYSIVLSYTTAENVASYSVSVLASGTYTGVFTDTPPAQFPINPAGPFITAGSTVIAGSWAGASSGPQIGGTFTIGTVQIASDWPAVAAYFGPNDGVWNSGGELIPATLFFTSCLHTNCVLPEPPIPEPSTGLLVMTGLLGLAYRRRRHGRAA